MQQGLPKAGTDELGTFARRALIVILLVALALLFWEWRSVLLLVFAAVLIGVGLHAIADPLAARTPLNKTWSLALAALIVLGVLIGIGWLFGAQIAGELNTIGERLPQAWSTARDRLGQLPGGPAIVRQLEGLANGEGGGGLGASFSRIGGAGLTIFGALLDALVVVVAAIFMAVNPRPYRQGVLRLAPQTARPELEGAMDESGRALKRWLFGTMISMAAMAAMVSIALMLLGVPAAVALGLLAGLGQFVPLIGPILAAVPGVLLALTVSPETALWVVLAYFVASTIEANILYPIIQQKAVELPSALTLFSIIAVGALFGPMGVVLAVPLTVVATILVKRFYIKAALGEPVEPTAPARD
jgi:predicted PurR-regulated permease PerM